MNADTDKYIVATHALWAGDVEYFENLLKDFSPAKKDASRVDFAETPEDFIKATGALRLRQLWRKRAEFNSLVAAHSESNLEITDKPIILKTAHLRAALWRTGEREFFMQGYLTELKWQRTLFDRAHEQAKKYLKPRLVQGKQPLLKFISTTKARVSPGSSWIAFGNPFLQIELTDMGLLEASGLWVKPLLPESGTEITNVFQALLESLDDPHPLRDIPEHEKIQ